LRDAVDREFYEDDYAASCLENHSGVSVKADKLEKNLSLNEPEISSRKFLKSITPNVKINNNFRLKAERELIALVAIAPQSAV
jgi:hypothetical protein